MFQKVGLLDIFIGLWNRKIRILLILCAAAVIGSAVALVDITDVGVATKDETYYKSVVLYIDTTKKTEGVDLISQAQKIRATYLSLYDTALFSEYLQDVVGPTVDAPVGDYLLTAKDVQNSNVTVPDSNIMAIYKSITFNAPANASTIIVAFECTDSDVGDKILDATYRFADEQLQEKVPYSTVTEIGRANYVHPAKEAASMTAAGIVKACIKNAIIYCIAAIFVYLLVAVFIMLFKPVVNRENDIREYGDFPVFSLTTGKNKNGLSAEAVYFARYAVRNLEGKFLGFAGCDDRCTQKKNANVKDVYNTLNKLGKKTLLVNFDPEFTAEFEYVDAKVDPDSVCYESTCDFKGLSVDDFDVVLVNFCSASDKGYLLSTDLPMNDMVLQVNVGKSTYRDVEKSMDILKQNDMKLFAVLAAK